MHYCCAFCGWLNGIAGCAAFLNMLCSLKWGIYVFFGAWQFIAIFFTLFLVPETRGVPIEEVSLSLPLLPGSLTS